MALYLSMGVHGLTSYLRENKRVLSKTIELPSVGGKESIHIIVDAWSLIFAVHQRCNLPLIYGGEYQEFSRLVTEVVTAWIKVGFKISFVFDGPYPEIKFHTLVSRASKNIEQSLLFFRTSATSRASPHFLKELRIIPPAYYSATLHALESLRDSTNTLDIHFADEECDPYAVELAARLNGFVIGNDSDFVILNSEGYQGYIPLDEMVWTGMLPDANPETVEDDGFQRVTKGKSQGRAAASSSSFGKGVIPPANVSHLSLSFSVFSPTVLAAHLSLPVSLLPLLASLAGNDFTNQEVTSRLNIHSMFFERSLSPVQRIDRVASTLQSILAPGTRRKAKHQVGSVMDLIDRTVNTLVAKITHTIGPGELDVIIDKVAEGALQYAIPKYEGESQGPKSLWPTGICAIHEPEICPALPFFSRLLEVEAEMEEEEDSDEVMLRFQIRTKYLDAYRKGQLPPLLMNMLSTGTYWNRLFIENPDLETVARLGQPIRQWTYAILDQALGLPRADDLESRSAEESSDDEMIGVVESDSDSDEIVDSDSGGHDLIEPLRGALKNLRHPNERGLTQSSSSLPTPRTLVITEYLRRGTRLVDESVEVPAITNLLQSISDSSSVFTQIMVPLAVQPEDVRLTVLLRALHSDIPGIRDLSPVELSAVLVLRWIVRTLSERARESSSKVRDAERWTTREAHCFIASFDFSGESAKAVDAVVPLVDRHIQLCAQVFHGLESITHLSQVLLLHPVVESAIHVFSGKAFHSYLTGARVCPNVPDNIWSLCTFEMDHAFSEEKKKKEKRGKSKTTSNPIMNPSAPGGYFGLLGDGMA